MTPTRFIFKTALRDTFVATQFNIYKWLTLAWENDTQKVYVVNSNGQETANKTVKRKTDSTWQDIDSTTKGYDGKGRLISEMRWLWDNFTKTWKNYVQFNSTFSGDSLEVLIKQPWSTATGNWANYERDSILYNVSGQMTSLVIQGWSNGNWLSVQRNSIQFNSKSKPNLYLIEKWVASLKTWAPFVKDTLFYGGSDRFIRQLGQNIDIQGNWINVFNVLLTYNGASINPSEYVNQFWDSTNLWTNNRKEIYTYNSHGDDSITLFQYYTGTQFLNAGRTLSNYDTAFNVTQKIRQNWNSGNGTWVNSQRGRWVYGRFTLIHIAQWKLKSRGIRNSKFGSHIPFHDLRERKISNIPFAKTILVR